MVSSRRPPARYRGRVEMAPASDVGSARSCASLSASESAVRPDWANPATWRSVMAAVICRAGCFRSLGKNRSRTATASGAPSSFFIVSSTVYVTLLSSLSPEAGGQISQKIRDFVVIIHKSRLIVKSRAAGGGFRRIPPVQIAQELARRGRNMRPAGQHAHSQCPDSRAKMPAGCTAASAWPRSKTCRCGCAPTAGRAVSGLTPAIS